MESVSPLLPHPHWVEQEGALAAEMVTTSAGLLEA